MATADEMKTRNIEVMGPELGKQYSELWQRVVKIHIYWCEYVEMFGTNPKRVAVMNQAAPAFFRMLQDELCDSTLMHLARLTDKSEMRGRKNLTIQNLPGLIDREVTRIKVDKLVKEVLEKTEFCRQRRHLKLAHDDLATALKEKKARPLAKATTAHVDEALQAIARTMHVIHSDYLHADMQFEPLGPRSTGAIGLLYVLRDGIKQREGRRKRIMDGKPTEDDFKPDEL